MRSSSRPPPGVRPRVSIITAVLDRAGTIGAALDSVAAQTCQDLEHVVVDGGSTDGTLERVQAARHAVRLTCERDHGIYDAFNRGLALATGEWVAFLNSDDAYAHPRVLEAVLAAAARHPDADVLHGDVDMVDPAGRVTRELRFVPGPEPYAAFGVTLPVFQPAAFVRRRLFERLGGFDATYRIVGDYELFLRAWRAGARFQHLPGVLVHMRDDGVSERRPWVRAVEVFQASRRHTGGVGAPLVELVRYGVTRTLEQRAPAVVVAARAVKRRLLGPPTGGVARWRRHA